MKVTVKELRERSSRVLEAVHDMNDVRLARLQCEANQPVTSMGPFSVAVHLQVKTLIVDEQTPAIEVWSRYRAQAQAEPEGEISEGPPAWSAEFEIVGTWARMPDVPVDDGDLPSFGIAVGGTALHPYARETLQSIVGRLGFPPFTMDILPSPANLSLDTVIDLEMDE